MVEIIVLSVAILIIIIVQNIGKGEPEPEKEKEEYIENVKVADFGAKLTESYLNLENYIGQRKNIDYLKGYINLAQEKNEPLQHIILWGPGGLGKSTLVKAVAQEMGGEFLEIVPANLRTVKDLYTALTYKQCICGYLNPYNTNKCLRCRRDIRLTFNPVAKLKAGTILFLEECHGLKDDIEEAMYSLMQDNYLIVNANGVDQRLDFPKITVAGATTQVGDLNKPFRDRFKLSIKLEPYSEDDLFRIVKMFCEHKGYEADEEALRQIAKLSYGIPRIAKKYVMDAVSRGLPITKRNVEEILDILDIDENGLDKHHRAILDYIHKRGQAGQMAIASSSGLGKNVYIEVYEPALLYKDYIYQGARGRMITEKAKEQYFKGCTCKHCEGK